MNTGRLLRLTAVALLGGYLSANLLPAQDAALPVVEEIVVDAPGAPPPAAAAPAREGPELPKGERYRQYQRVLVDWIQETCGLSETQRQLLAPLVEDFGGSVVAAMIGGGWEETTPNFASNISIPGILKLSLLDSVRQEILTPDQLPKLEASLRDRTVFQRTAMRDLAIASLDALAGFTAPQRSQLQATWKASSVDLDLSSRLRLETGADRQFGKGVPAQFLESLSQDQQAWLRTWQIEPSDQWTFTCRDRELVPEDQEKVDAVIAQGRQAILKSVELQIAMYAIHAEVTPQQIEALRLAGKKIAVDTAENWLQRNIHAQKNAQSDFTATVTIRRDGLGPVLDNEIRRREVFLRQHAVWQEALRTIPLEVRSRALKERNGFHRLARAEFVLAALDQELWLRPDQREPMRHLVWRSLPAVVDLPVDDDERDLAWCALPLVDSAEDPPAFLNREQQACWGVLKMQYDESARNKIRELVEKANAGIFDRERPRVEVIMDSLIEQAE